MADNYQTKYLRLRFELQDPTPDFENQKKAWEELKQLIIKLKVQHGSTMINLVGFEDIGG